MPDDDNLSAWRYLHGVGPAPRPDAEHVEPLARDRIYQFPDEDIVFVTDSSPGTGLDTWDW